MTGAARAAVRRIVADENAARGEEERLHGRSLPLALRRVRFPMVLEVDAHKQWRIKIDIESTAIESREVDAARLLFGHPLPYCGKLNGSRIARLAG